MCEYISLLNCYRSKVEKELFYMAILKITVMVRKYLTSYPNIIVFNLKLLRMDIIGPGSFIKFCLPLKERERHATEQIEKEVVYQRLDCKSLKS